MFKIMYFLLFFLINFVLVSSSHELYGVNLFDSITVRPVTERVVHNPLSKTCMNKISQHILQCLENQMIKRTETSHGKNSNQTLCCSIWDSADCVANSVKAKCSAFDKYKMKLHLKELAKYQEKTPCKVFPYHSKQCGYNLTDEQIVDLATTKSIDIETSKITEAYTRQAITLPYSDKCEGIINQVGAMCREEIRRKNNSTYRNVKLYKSVNEQDEDDNCCPSWESIRCIEKSVTENCTKTEIKEFANIAYQELIEICPGPDSCHFNQDNQTDSGAGTVITSLFKLLVLTTLISLIK